MATETAALAGAPATGKVESKGLKGNAIGYLSNVVIGVASTAPAYSLAATLGFIVADPGVTTHAPGVLLAAFVPMLLISVGYRWLNKADPDSGTTFAWTTRAFGPSFGWLNGWAIFWADLLVMTSLGYIAATYTFLLFEWHWAEVHKGAAFGGTVIWTLLMTWICYRGIELSARLQQLLLSFEVVMLGIFAVVALVDVYSGTAAVHSIEPKADWFNPFAIPFHDLVVALLLGIFIYWGWDSGVAVNEESEDANEGPGRAAVVSTLLLVVIYLVVSAGAQSYHGTGFISNEENAKDVLHALGKGVLGSVGVRFLLVAVLTSAAASTQTTILPTARTTLSMAKWGAIPKVIGRIHTRYLTPTVSTWGFGLLSILVAVPLIFLGNALELAVVALGIPVTFYYGSTGFATAWYYRRELFDNARKFFLVGLLPVAGGLIMYGIGIYAIKYYGEKAHVEGAKEYAGLTLPLWFGAIGMVLGAVVMLASRPYFRAFFSRKTEVAAPGLLDAPVERAPAHFLGPEHVTTGEHILTPEAEQPTSQPPVT
jgi:amino acid transporter